MPIWICLALCVLSWLVSRSDANAAQLKGYVWNCPDKPAICWWHKAVVEPPKGWAENETWTMRYKALVMFPDGRNDKTKPVMYVRTHSGDKTLALDEYIRVAQERWKGRIPDSSIEPLADLDRAGKPGFKVYLYRNPSQPEQAFELTAFMKDVDAAHPEQTYFFQVVLSSPSMDELEKAKPAFYELLGKL